MSLRVLFSLLLSLFLVLIFSIILYINLQTARESIQDQLHALTQDSVYSLSLSLASVGDIRDVGMTEGMINAIFDSGYYEYIRLRDANGSLIVEQSLPVVVKDVPKWFIRWLPLQIPEAEGMVSRGWERAGTLSVKAHAGYAYAQLWALSKRVTLSILVIGGVAQAVLLLLISLVLRSLRRIESQADAINENRFIVLEDTLFIREFRTLIEAMNRMVHKVEGIFEKEAKVYHDYLELLYKDEETGLPNRKYLMLRFHELLDGSDQAPRGCVAIVSVNRLEELKRLEGYQSYVRQLEGIVKLVRGSLLHSEHLFRISENELLMLFPSQELPEVSLQLDQLSKKLRRIMRRIDDMDDNLCFYIGLSPYAESDDTTRIFSRVDYALNTAKMRGPCVVTPYDEHASDDSLVLGREEWHEKIEAVLREERIRIAGHKVFDLLENRVYHREIYLRIEEEDGTLTSAGYYLPMAKLFGLVDRFDQAVVQIVHTHMLRFTDPLALNLSHAYVTQSSNTPQIEQMLRSCSAARQACEIHIECAESEVLQDVRAYTELAALVHAYGHRFGIDRFTGLGSVGYIKSLRPDYVKINASFVLDEDPDHQKALDSLDIIARSLEIDLVVTGVENESTFERLRALNYRWMQGNWFEGAEPVELNG